MIKAACPHSSINIQQFAITDYESMWQRMRFHNAYQNNTSADEIWITEHYPVFTLGLAGRWQHIHNATASAIPIISSDRGGQVTYHGPGQIMVYTLINLTRRKIGVREFVSLLESAVISVLKSINVSAHQWRGRPGVYVENEKIAALGLRVKRGACYHGLSFNVGIDLSPFKFIDSCGYSELSVTNLAQVLGSNNKFSNNINTPFFWGKTIAKEIKHLLEAAQ